MSKQISLGNCDLFVTVDDADFEYLSQFKWRRSFTRSRQNPKIYAIRHIRGDDNAGLLMHRELLQPQRGRIIDHINGNGLDNQRANLRICSIAENSRNRGVPLKGSSPFKGVCLEKASGRYVAKITVNYKAIALGHYHDPVDAAHAYDAAARKYHGEFAYFNFPEAA